MATAVKRKRRRSGGKGTKRPSYRTVRKPASRKKPKKRAMTALSAAACLLVILGALFLSDGGDSGGNYMEYGSDPALDISAGDFTDPRTKNNLDLVTYATQAWEHRWGYVWGTFGLELTRTLLAAKVQQYPDRVGSRMEFIRDNWLGRRTTDCIGLIKSYSWFDPYTRRIEYGTGGMPDINADQMYEAASEKGKLGGLFHRIPEIPGLLVYTPGHIGVYVGDGYVIEARGTEYGVVKTRLEERGFDYWLKDPYITYYE